MIINNCCFFITAKNDCGKPPINKARTRITGAKLGDAVTVSSFSKCKSRCKSTKGCVAMEYKFTNPKKCQLFSAVESTQENVQDYRSAFCTEPTSPGGIIKPTERPAPGGTSEPVTEGPSPTGPNKVCSSKMAADVSFVVDGSRSVTAANWEIIKQFMNNVVDKFVIGDDQVSVLYLDIPC